MSRKKVVLFFVVLGIFCAFYLLLNHSVHLTQSTASPRQVSVICRSADTEEWSTMKQGIDRAAKDFGVDVSFITLTSRNSAKEQISLLSREIDGGADAVILAPVNSTALTQPVYSAQEKVPVIAMQSSTQGLQSLQTVACDNVRMGSALAKEMCREELPNTPAVILCGSTMSSNEEDFLKGLKQGLKGRPVQCSTLTDVDSGETFAQVKQMFQRQPGAFFVALNAEMLETAAQAKQALGVQAHLYGAGRSNQIVSLLEQKIVSATAVSNDYNMGYLSLKAAVDQMEKKKSSNIEINSLIINSNDIYQPQNERILFPFV
ncbi:MAG: substrate-binding domain-containing protein [Oscillospiraceae bacterium]|jgi:ribose transport system substrate-binding protein|nr:substrate-binding domain-containing protein [Oscillospiraceae bacterium]